MSGDLPVIEPELDKIREMLVFVKYHESPHQWEYRCKHFVEKLPDGKPGCAIYSERPRMCAEYPKDESIPLTPKCGYMIDRQEKINNP